MEIGVLGAGAWGAAFAKLLLDGGHRVQLWARNNTCVEKINTNKQLFIKESVSGEYEFLSATCDINKFSKQKDLLVYALPSKVLQKLFTETPMDLNIPIVLLAKGFINEEGQMPHEWLKRQGYKSVFVLSGPNLAIEIFNDLPASAVLAGSKNELLKSIQLALHSENFRVYANSDMNGVALGGIVKNAYTIAAGMCEGLGLGINAKSALLTRMIAELQGMYSVFNADSQTMIGLSGLGDLILSSSSPNSRNFKYGYLLAKAPEKAALFLEKNTVEGVRTVKILLNKLKQLNQVYPILELIDQILDRKITVEKAIQCLMNRDLKQEF